MENNYNNYNGQNKQNDEYKEQFYKSESHNHEFQSSADYQKVANTEE